MLPKKFPYVSGRFHILIILFTLHRINKGEREKKNNYFTKRDFVSKCAFYGYVKGSVLNKPDQTHDYKCQKHKTKHRVKLFFCAYSKRD